MEPIDPISVPAATADRRSPLPRVACGLIAAAAAFPVLAQFWLTLLGAFDLGMAKTILVFFSFFTILTNTAVAIAAGRLAWRFDGRFTRPRVATALAVYVTVVCCLYEILLRHLWHPRGLGLLIDTLFHDVVPLAWLAVWFVFIPKGTLRPRDAGVWLAGPLVYGLWVGGVALLTRRVPYPFLNVTTIGPFRLAINLAALLAVFGGIGLMFVAIDRAVGRPRTPR